MSSHLSYIAGLDPEDLTRKQWQKLFRLAGLMRFEKTEDEEDEETDKAAKENGDLVNLQEEKKGKSKPPKVKADDLPEGIAEADEKDAEKAKKKGRG
jgi:hypothetical protein